MCSRSVLLATEPHLRLDDALVYIYICYLSGS